MSPRPRKRGRVLSEDLILLLEEQLLWCGECRGYTDHKELWHRAWKPSYALRMVWPLECEVCKKTKDAPAYAGILEE